MIAPTGAHIVQEDLIDLLSPGRGVFPRQPLDVTQQFFRLVLVYPVTDVLGRKKSV